jgi:tRNA nucleotidyltransferase/poly(A) polymerase
MLINNIHTQVQQILQAPVYLVGGCVRDFLMGTEPKDFDFCTAILPDVVEDRIRSTGRKAYSLGKKFGTSTLSPILNRICVGGILRSIVWQWILMAR